LAAGEFTSQIHLFLDDLGLREIILIAQGTGEGSAAKGP